MMTAASTMLISMEPTAMHNPMDASATEKILLNLVRRVLLNFDLCQHFTVFHCDKEKNGGND